MEAKDTVINLDETTNTSLRIAMTKILGEQAEISFKVGYKYALEGAVMNGAYESIKKAGIREVVEWIKPYRCNNPEDMAHSWILVPPDEWQAKLESWGIK